MSADKQPGKLTPSPLGVLKVRMQDGKLRELHMNRADRRRFIRAHHLVKN